MGLIDKLRKQAGIFKNRLASALSGLKGVTVGAARTRRGVRFAARATRLTTPLGLGLTAVSFGPEIVRGVRTAGRFLQRAIPRGVAFVGGRRVVSGIAGGGGAGVVAGLITRKSGGVQRPSDFGDPSLQSRPNGPSVTRVRRRPTAKRKPTTRRKARVTKRRARRKVTRKRKRRTHASPRHRGHKVVKFTTKDGKKVRFLVNPKARHR